jgi:Bardet-Biedl syndrome 1 protein
MHQNINNLKTVKNLNFELLLIISVIAVSVGSSVLFYRNMKPYFKYTVPSLMIEPLEEEIWKKLSVERQSNYEKLIKDLNSMNISQMSSLSHKLISLDVDERDSFIRENAEFKLERLPAIVCLTTIYKNMEDEKASNCLVIATDAGEIFIMDSQTFNILHEARVCSFKATPDLISSSGSYLNDFKIVIATRECSICILRRGWLEGREIVRLEQPALALSLLQIDQTIVVLGKSLMCYSKKGKMLWLLNVPSEVTCMTPVPLPHLGVSMVSNES